MHSLLPVHLLQLQAHAMGVDAIDKKDLEISMFSYLS